MKKHLRLVKFIIYFFIFCCFVGCSGKNSTDIDKGERPSLENIISYANVYKDYTDEDLKKLKRFDIVAIEPYYVPDRQFFAELKSAGI